MGTYLRNALSPAVIDRMEVNEEKHSLLVIVANDQLSLTIGKKGQNVRLASNLLKWNIDVKSESILQEESQQEAQNEVIAGLRSLLGIKAPQAASLAAEGLVDMARLAECDVEVLTQLKGIGEISARAIIAAAREAMQRDGTAENGSEKE
jgi:N utilization substance protein A